MKLDELKKPFPAELISWRVGATNAKKNNGKATKGIALAYIDARDVMERLDEVCGVGNWQCVHPHANGKTSCRIGIKIGDEWIWKENGAGDSNESAEKGAFSDSFKRAAVLWGIGRYLYDVPNVWVDLDDWGKIKNPNDPRLKKALEAAEKGIRLPNEPEPKEDYQDKLDRAIKKTRELVSYEDVLTFSKQKSVVEMYAHLSEEQQQKWTNALNDAMSRTSQSPLAEVAE